MIFNPLHYLALLEQKTNALDQAAPLQNWQLGEEFLKLRRRMEVRLGKRVRRDLLRLVETFSLPEVAAAIRQALRFPAIAFDAVKHLLLCAIEQRPPRLDLENYPHLPMAEVALTRAANYQVLLFGRRGNGHASSVVGALSEAAPPAHHNARVSQAGRTVRENKEPSSNSSAALSRVGDAGPESGVPHLSSKARRIQAAKFPVSKSLET